LVSYCQSGLPRWLKTSRRPPCRRRHCEWRRAPQACRRRRGPGVRPGRGGRMCEGNRTSNVERRRHSTGHLNSLPRPIPAPARTHFRCS
jgi:hypothetical protein